MHHQLNRIVVKRTANYVTFELRRLVFWRHFNWDTVQMNKKNNQLLIDVCQMPSVTPHIIASMYRTYSSLAEGRQNISVN